MGNSSSDTNAVNVFQEILRAQIEALEATDRAQRELECKDRRFMNNFVRLDTTDRAGVNETANDHVTQKRSKTKKTIEQERREEERRLKEERRRHEERERQRIEQERKELEEKERKRYEEERERKKQQEEGQKKIERERLKQLNREVSAEREKILHYKLISSEGRATDVSEIFHLRIGVFGPTGSGKSCFINTCERAVHQTDKGSVPEGSSGSEGTIILQEYLSELCINLVDTRGFFNYDVDESRVFKDILFGDIKPGDVIQYGKQTAAAQTKTENEFSDWLHGAIFVVSGNDCRLKNGTLTVRLASARGIVQNAGISSVTVVTCEDKLTTESAKKTARSEASVATGSSLSRTFLLSTYCSELPNKCAETELQAMRVLTCAMTMAEQYVSDAIHRRRAWAKKTLERASGKQRRNNEKVAIEKISVATFLDILEEEEYFSRPAVDNLANILESNDIRNVGTLALSWSDVKSLIKEEKMRTAIQSKLQEMELIKRIKKLL